MIREDSKPGMTAPRGILQCMVRRHSRSPLTRVVKPYPVEERRGEERRGEERRGREVSINN